MKNIVLVDFPEKWPSLMPQLTQNLQSQVWLWTASIHHGLCAAWDIALTTYMHDSHDNASSGTFSHMHTTTAQLNMLCRTSKDYMAPCMRCA